MIARQVVLHYEVGYIALIISPTGVGIRSPYLSIWFANIDFGLMDLGQQSGHQETYAGTILFVADYVFHPLDCLEGIYQGVVQVG